MPEKRIEIVSEVNNVITFEEIKTDIVDRIDVEETEKAITELEKQKLLIEEKLVKLKEKLEFAKHIIALADEKKLREQEELEKETSSVNTVL